MRLNKIADGASVVITLGFLFFLFSTVQWPEMGRVLKGMDAFYFVLAVLVALFSSAWIGAGRFRMIIKVLGGEISFAEAFRVKLGSQPLNLLPSGQADLLSQVVYLKRNSRFSYISGLYYVVLALVSKVLALLIPVAVMLLFFWPPGYLPALERFKPVLWACCAAGMVPVLIWVLIRLKSFRRAVLSWIPVADTGWASEVRKAVDVYGGISSGPMAGLLLYSMAFQYSQFLVFYWLARSLGLGISLFAVVMFLPLVVILSNIPVTVGGFGLRESLIVLFFASYGGKEAALALGVLFSFAEYIVPAFFGLFFLRPYLKKLF